VLTESLPDLGLEAFDRLEPCDAVPDIGSFANISVPTTVSFWRKSQESSTRHENPMLQSRFGLNPDTALTVDCLHAVHLGVLKVWCTVAVWQVLTSGIYGSVGAADENLQVAVLAFRGSLMSWYRARHLAHPAECLTRVADFTIKMIGKRSEPCLKTKAAETFGLMKFLLHVLTSYTFRIGPDWQRLLKAGDALDKMLGIWSKHSHSWTVPADDRKECGTERSHALELALSEPTLTSTFKSVECRCKVGARLV
jgi:hypothetical protein